MRVNLDISSQLPILNSVFSCLRKVKNLHVAYKDDDGKSVYKANLMQFLQRKFLK